jgi:hypothetical protein
VGQCGKLCAHSARCWENAGYTTSEHTTFSASDTPEDFCRQCSGWGGCVNYRLEFFSTDTERYRQLMISFMSVVYQGWVDRCYHQAAGNPLFMAIFAIISVAYFALAGIIHGAIIGIFSYNYPMPRHGCPTLLVPARM